MCPLLLALLLATPAPALACSWNYDETFFGCDELGIRRSVGRTLPSSSDIISVVPAALPTVPTPVGVEATFSSRVDGPGERKLQASVIKGFRYVGLGLATWGEQNFSNNDITEHFRGTSLESTYFTNARTAGDRQGFPLGQFARTAARGLEKTVRLTAGGYVGQGEQSWVPGAGYGLAADLQFFNLAYNEERLTLSDALPALKARTFAAGFQLRQLYLGYTRAKLTGAGALPASQTYQAKVTLGDWSALAGWKRLHDHNARAVAVNWTSASVQRRFGNLGVGYLYGLYRNAHSLSPQLYI